MSGDSSLKLHDEAILRLDGGSAHGDRAETRGNYAEVLGAARWAEEQGLAAFALPDHYLSSSSDVSAPAWDHLVHLAGLARETSTIQLVDLVSPVTFRHPAVHAKMAATIHDMSGGRLTFGLGTGWLEEEHSLLGFDFPSQRKRFELLEEQLAYLAGARSR